MILDYPPGPSVITSVLTSGKGAGQSGFMIQREKNMAGRYWLVLKMEGATCQGSRQPPEVRNDKKIYCPLESPERRRLGT